MSRSDWPHLSRSVGQLIATAMSRGQVLNPTGGQEMCAFHAACGPGNADSNVAVA